MRRFAAALTAIAATLAVVSVASPAEAGRHDRVRPLAQAHAHNDYEHERPLLDALSHGFTSVEADVYLIDGELLVAHDLEDVQPGRTLEKLYLEPLARRVKENRGSVHHRRGDFQLLIDLKNTGPATYAAVEDALARYPQVFTTAAQKHGRTHVRRGAVQAVVSGDRPLADMQARPVRRGFYDGRLTDLEGGLPASFMPLVSDNWTNHFTWTGVGPFPAAEKAKLRSIVDRAHRAGYRVRFWATPDVAGTARDALWSELVKAGVDHVNTDDLAGLERFLRHRR